MDKIKRPPVNAPFFWFKKKYRVGTLAPRVRTVASVPGEGRYPGTGYPGTGDGYRVGALAP